MLGKLGEVAVLVAVAVAAAQAMVMTMVMVAVSVGRTLVVMVPALVLVPVPVLVMLQIPVLGLVFTQKCYDVFLTNGLLAGSLDVFDLPCIKVTLAKGLGWGIVIFSGILKVCMWCIARPVIESIYSSCC